MMCDCPGGFICPGGGCVISIRVQGGYFINKYIETFSMRKLVVYRI